jgi:valyl-tRNA synthetase
VVITGTCADTGLQAALAEELALVSTLARLDADASSVASEPPVAAVADPGAFVQLVVSEGVEVYLPLSGIVDPVKEIGRLTKQANPKLQPYTLRPTLYTLHPTP